MDVPVRGLEPGMNYVLQARSKGLNGVTSGWSISSKFLTISDTTPPNPVTSLTWVVSGSSFLATWVGPTLDSNGNPLRDFNGYVVTLTAGTVSKVYIVDNERFDFSFAQNVGAFGTSQATVGINVKARDIVGNLSTAATATATNPAPADVTTFTATGIPLAISLKWDVSTETDFKEYDIYMSTSGAAFVPGPSNLINRSATPSFVLPTSNQVIHYFKIKQVDLFDQPSVNFVSAQATPIISTDLDLTPPAAPTGVTVTTAVGGPGTSTISVGWTAVTSTNLGGYVVRYSTDQTTWQYVNVPSNRTSALVIGLPPSTTYYVGVAAVSYVNAYSAFVNAAPYPVTTAADTTAPSTPSAPTVSFGTSLIQVSHNMTKAVGGAMESDVRYLEVHGSTVTGFTPSSTTTFGSIDVPAPGIAVSANFTYSPTDVVTNMFWKVIAVDYAGNKSVASAQATGMPGLIQGANIADATITNAKINDLSAAKLTAGTAFINNLFVRSALTVDTTTGFVQSSNFSTPSTTGWRLDQAGLVIYDGSITAKSLLLQESVNVAPPQFSDFEFVKDYYHDTSNVGNSTQLTAASGMLLNIGNSFSKFGSQGLRIYNSTVTSPTLDTLVLAPNGLTTTGLNVDVIPGEWIYSVWMKKNGTIDQRVQLALYTDLGTTIISPDINITSTTYSQYGAKLVIPSGVQKVKLYLLVGPLAANTGYDINIDGLQMERKTGGLNTPSPWKPPSKTTIDGGAIMTGSIRSSAPAIGITTQPAWSINTQGNIQVGDALVRGSMIVGAGADLSTSFVQASNYSAGVSGWTIKGDGTVEFNNGTFRGQLNIARTTSSKTYGVIIDSADQTFRYNTNSSLPNSSVAITQGAPRINFKGFAQQYVTDATGALVLDSNSPAQASLRMTPAGNMQLIAVPNQSSVIDVTDGNYVFLNDTDRINEDYAYTLSTWGAPRFAPQSATIPLSSQYTHSATSFKKSNTAGSPPKYRTASITNGATKAEKGYVYDLQSSVSNRSEGEHSFVSDNKMRANFDNFTNTIAYYNTNTLRTSISATALTPNMWAAARKNLTGLKCTFSATTGEIYFAASTTDFHFSIVPGTTKVMISGWFSTARTNMQVQAVVMPNAGSPILGPVKYINKDPALAGLVAGEPYCYGYTTIIDIPTPSTATLCYIGFKFSNITVADTVTMTAFTLGDYRDDNDPNRFAEIGATDSINGSSNIITTFNPYPDKYELATSATKATSTTNNLNWANAWAPSQTNTKLAVVQEVLSTTTALGYTERRTRLSRNGFAVGELQDPSMPNAISYYTNGAHPSNIGANASDQRYGIIPTIPSITKLDGTSMQPIYQETGFIVYNHGGGGTPIGGGEPSSAGTAGPAVFVANRAGIYAMSSFMQVHWDGSDVGPPGALAWWKLPAGSNPATTSGSIISYSPFNGTLWEVSSSTMSFASVGDMFYCMLIVYGGRMNAAVPGDSGINGQRRIFNPSMTFAQIV